MQKNLISIIIPVYNQADKLIQCLDSILAQTYQNIEIIIVNDGSTDSIELRITNYELRFKNFKYIYQKNSGANVARNRGFKEVQGEFVLFCDADIIMEPKMLEIMLETLKNNPSSSYAYSSHKFGFKVFRLWKFDAEKLKQMPCVHTTSLIRKKHFVGFDERIKRLQDWDLWLSMLEKGYAGVWVDRVLFKVQTGGTMSAWLPSFVYKFMPFLLSVKKYKQAVEIIKNKHGLL